MQNFMWGCLLVYMVYFFMFFAVCVGREGVRKPLLLHMYHIYLITYPHLSWSP